MSARPSPTAEQKKSGPPRHGKAKKIEAQRQRTFPWPKDRDRARGALERWHEIGMVLLQHRKMKLNFMSVVWRFVNLDSGQFWMTSETAAKVAGECCAKTIDRDIEKMEKLGILIVKIDRVQEKKKWVTRRVGRLSLPENLPNGIKADDVWKDYRCPPEDELWMDNACPQNPDNRSPLTPEDTLEEEERGNAE